MGWLSGWVYRYKHTIKAATGAGTNYQCRIRVNYDKLLDATSKIGRYEGTNPVIAEDPNMVLLIHGDGADESANFYDDATGKTITSVGNVQVDTAQKVFGTGSIYFDGTGDYLTLADSEDWNFGSGDFVIDARVRFDDLPAASASMCLVSQYVNDNSRVFFDLYNNAGTYQWRVFAKNDTTSAVNFAVNITSIEADKWYHIAFVRNGDNFSVWQDAVQVGSTVEDSDDWVNIAGNLQIGVHNPAGVTRYMKGWIDELAIRKGTYAAPSWIPGQTPTAPYGPRWIREPGNILYESGDSGKEYKTFMSGWGKSGTDDTSIYYYYSTDGKTWTVSENNPVIRQLGSDEWEDPYVVKSGSTYYLYCENHADGKIYCFTSSDCVTWTSQGMVLDRGVSPAWDYYLVGSPVVWIENGNWYMLYEGMTGTTAGDIGLATSANGLSWSKSGSNPVFSKAGSGWDGGVVASDDIYKDGDTYYLIYHGDSADNASCGIGIAKSTNLTSWTRCNGGKRIYLEGETDITAVATCAQSAQIYPDNPRQFLYCSDNVTGTSGFTRGMYFGYLENNEVIALGGNCKTDFGDIRFTDDDEETLLPYFLEHKTDSVTATYTVKVTDDLSSVDRDIYLYYDNSEATDISDGTNTFIFYDGGTGTLGDKWSTAGTGTVEYTGGELHIKAGASATAWARAYRTQDMTDGRVLEYRAKMVDGTQQTGDVGRQNAASWETWYWLIFRATYSATKNWRLYTRQSGGWDVRASTTFIPSFNTYYRYSCFDKGNNIRIICRDDDGYFIEQLASTNYDAGDWHLTFAEMKGNANSDESYIDDIRVRKYVDPEPRHSTWYSVEQIFVDQTKTFNIETLIKKLKVSKQLSTDTYILKSNVSKTLSSDLLLFRSATETLSIDTLLKQLDVTKTYTIDELLKKLNITVNLTVTTLLLKTDIVELDINTQILKTLTKTFLTDLLIKKLDKTESYTVDVLTKKLSISQTLDVDSLIRKTDTKPLDIDIIISGAAAANLIIDTLIKKLDLTKTFTVDELLKETNIIVEYEIDSIFRKAISKPLTVDTLILKELTKTFLTDILTKKLDITESYTVDTLTKKLNIPETLDVDSLIRKTEAETLNIDTIISMLGLEPLDIDALIRKTQTEPLNIDMTISGALISSILINALIKKLDITKTFTVDELLKETDKLADYMVDTLIKKALPKTLTLETSILKELTETFLNDLLIKKLDITETYTIDTLIGKLGLKTLIIDTLIRSTETEPLTIELSILKTLSEPLTVDTILAGIKTVDLTVDLLLKKIKTANIDIDAIIVGALTSPLSIDVLLQATPIKELLIDIIIFLASLSQDFVLDSIITFGGPFGITQFIIRRAKESPFTVTQIKDKVSVEKSGGKPVEY